MNGRRTLAAAIATLVWIGLVGLGWASVWGDTALIWLVVFVIGLAVIWTVASRPGRRGTRPPNRGS